MKKRNNNFDWDEVNAKVDRKGFLRTTRYETEVGTSDYAVHQSDSFNTKIRLDRINSKYPVKKKKRKR